MAGDECLSRYGCYRKWYDCLPIIPPSKDGHDWWSKDKSGRCTPYERLRRVWFDYTRFGIPKEDEERPHEFGNPGHETHLVCAIWERFSAIHPKDWIPRILALVGLPAMNVVDANWSYEFEALVEGGPKCKLADIVLHARDDVGDELLMVIEAKRKGGKLKENCDLPDTQPESYLDREVFRTIDRRHLIYLVDQSYEATVRKLVNSDDPRWSVITWQVLASLQAELVGQVSQVGDWLRKFFCWHAARYGLADESCSPTADWLVMNAPQRLDDAPYGEIIRSAIYYLQRTDINEQCEVPFSYLMGEKLFKEIHHTPENERQKTSARRCPFWRLP